MGWYTDDLRRVTDVLPQYEWAIYASVATALISFIGFKFMVDVYARLPEGWERYNRRS